MRPAGFAAVALAALLTAAGPPAAARSGSEPPGAAVAEPAVLMLSQLPPEGQLTWRLIHRGGPFPHEKDGTVFGNRERLLPMQKHGFYREYTVARPLSRERGARRIVCGGPSSNPVVCYYTADHYFSFQRLAGTLD